MNIKNLFKKGICIACMAGVLESGLPVKAKEPVGKAVRIVEEKSEKGYLVKLTNRTGKEIVQIEVKEAENQETSEDEEKKEIKNDETFELCFDPGEEIPMEKLPEARCDLEISFDDETKAVLHAFHFADMEEGELFLEDAAFVVYTSICTEEEISTKAAELKIWRSENPSEEKEELFYPDAELSGGKEDCLTEALMY